MAENPTLYLPDFKVKWGFALQHRRPIERTIARSGRQKRRRPGYSKRLRILSAPSRDFSPEDAASILAFYDTVEAGWMSFYAFTPHPISYIGKSFGTVTSVTTLLIYYRDVTLSSLTVGGTPYPGATITENADGNGNARINFGATVTGEVITNIRARERMVVVFSGDALDEQFLQDAADPHSSFNVVLEEVL